VKLWITSHQTTGDGDCGFDIVGAFSTESRAKDAVDRTEPCAYEHDHGYWRCICVSRRHWFAPHQLQCLVPTDDLFQCYGSHEHNDYCCFVDEVEVDSFVPIRIVDGVSRETSLMIDA
jgi:hypothetical protein